MSSIIIFILILIIFVYTLFSLGWAGSYILLNENWREYLVYTPNTVTTPHQIYEIDKVIYAVKTAPLSLSIISALSFLILLGIIVYWIRKRFKRQR